MDNIFIILFLLSLISLPVALIKPHLLERITKHRFTRLKAGLLLGVMTLLFFVLFGITTSPPSVKQEKKEANQKVETAAFEEEKSKETEKPSPTPTHTPTAKPTAQQQSNVYNVISVIDGDTIQVVIDGKKETLRLIGIDTPETVDPRKPVQCFGKEASAKAKSLLSGKSVRLESDSTQGERDKYQRLLRYVFLEDGTSFNKLMISEGYAYEYTYNVPYKYQAEYKQAQKEAEVNKRGLWADDACATSTTPQPTTSVSSSGSTGATSGVSGNSGGFTCAGKTTCGQMASCAEAEFYLKNCGVSRLDGDKDGVPCETICN